MSVNTAQSGHPAKPTLLITGAGGFLGYPLTLLARQHWAVAAIYRRRQPKMENVTTIQADLTDGARMDDIFSRVRPHAVIHAAAMAQVGTCQADPEGTEAINVLVPQRLAEKCARLGIDYLFTSTDLVFDGRQAPYDETAAVNPLSVYADQKIRAEEKVLHSYPNALVCRLPLMFGMAPGAEKNFTVQMLTSMVARKELALFVDEYRTPVDSESAARGMLTLLGRAHGLVHLGGRTRVSRYDLGMMMADALRIKPAMIRAVCIADLNLSTPRSPDCSLISRRAYKMGYDPAPLKQAVQRTVDQFLRQP